MDENRLKTKNGGTYIQFEDMKNIKDSMQIDSDTEICSYEAPDGKFKVTIEVRGEVNLIYYPTGKPDEDEAENYRYPSEFPQEVKDIIAQGDLFDSDKIYVDNNNWFELFIWDDENNYLDSDVIDGYIEGETPEYIAEYCENYLETVRREAGWMDE